MATAEELLQNAAETLSESPAEVCVIDEETRTINVPPGESLFGVTGDKDVERKYFQCPKIVGDNIDLSQHQINIAYVFTSTQNSTVFPSVGIAKYHCEDVKVSGDNITFSWKLSGNVLATPGFIAFKVMAAKNEGSNLKTKWSTAPAFGTVLITVPDGEEIAEEYPDIINQLFEEMEKVQEIATPEAMKGYVEAYMQEHPVTGGMTEEQEKQLDQNIQDVADLKNAIKNNSEKIDSLSEDLDYITDNENLFDKNEIVTGYRLASSGQPYADTDYYYSNYIPVEFGKTYKRNSPILDEKHRVCHYKFYNGMYNFIGTVWNTNEIVINDTNVTHIRFCGLQSEVNTTTLFGEVTAQDNVAREKVTKLELDIENANSYCENIVTEISSKTDVTGVNIYRGVYADTNKVQDGDILYLYAIVKSSENGATNLYINNVNYVNNPNNDYYEISHSEIAKQTAGGNYEFNIKYVYPISVTSELSIKKTLIINLTSLFGNNCEPSKEDMDKIVFGLDEEIDKPLTKLLLKNVVTMQSSLIRGLRGNNVYASKNGNTVMTSTPNYYWNEWSEIGNYGQENRGNIPIYNKVHGTLETDGMLSVLPIWGCWSENSAAKGTGSKYHGAHVFHGWTTDRKHRLTMLQNMYRDDEAAIFNYIPGDKANNGEGTFLRLRLGADNIGKGILIEPVLDYNNHYAYTRWVVFGRLNIQSDRSKYDVNGDGESAYTKGLPVNTIPSSSTSDGIKGDFTFDSNYAYFCVDDNKWKRIPLEEW